MNDAPFAPGTPVRVLPLAGAANSRARAETGVVVEFHAATDEYLLRIAGYAWPWLVDAHRVQKKVDG